MWGNIQWKYWADHRKTNQKMKLPMILPDRNNNYYNMTCALTVIFFYVLTSASMIFNIFLMLLGTFCY